MAAELDGLPGAELVRVGVAARARGERTVAALVVSLAPTRLTAVGVEVPVVDGWPEEVELALFEALRADPSVDDAYARYNALRRELDSFLAAAEHRVA